MNGRHSKFVVQELRELHSHECVSCVQVGNVRVDHCGHHTRWRQWRACHWVNARTANTWKSKSLSCYISICNSFRHQNATTVLNYLTNQLELGLEPKCNDCWHWNRTTSGTQLGLLGAQFLSSIINGKKLSKQCEAQDFLAFYYFLIYHSYHLNTHSNGQILQFKCEGQMLTLSFIRISRRCEIVFNLDTSIYKRSRNMA